MELDNISESDLIKCREVLQALVAERTLMSRINADERKALLMAAGQFSRPDRLEVMKIAKRHRRNRDKKKKDADRAARAETHIRKAREASVFVAPLQISGAIETPPPAGQVKLENPRACYVCKTEYQTLHFFYDSMCTPCGDLNYKKRFQTAGLDGRVALITGSRVKIGFQSALLLLRAGARVIVTTRFPHDAASRFSREHDFKQWQSRLQIFGLDLRHAPSVEIFCSYLNDTLDRLDYIINNAAQTVRRPPGFYDHMADLEAKPFSDLAPDLQSILAHYDRCKTVLESHYALPTEPKESGKSEGWMTSWYGASGGLGIRAPALSARIPWVKEKETDNGLLFPEGRLDADLQQIDLRQMNSWRLKLADVPTPEMIEVQLVNSIAPFILNAKLKALMLRNRDNEKHIVNVSAMEGKFTRYTKTDKHPHTNMAKAALNMMTVTSAPDYAKDGIYMNAVDTGWVTDEDPIELSSAKQAEHDFHPPLDIVDGAARICDPIFMSVLTGEHVWGKFLKDYTFTTW